MAINKQTIISAFDDKLTLLQWLKTINKALDEAVLTGVEVRQKGNATYSFVVTFEDGTELESNEFVLAQGESINGATIRNGHLYLSLTNGDELDAGNVKPVTSFEINASQHLIVNYGDGTSQDLGTLADFSSADFVAKTLNQTEANFIGVLNILPLDQIENNNIYSRMEVINGVLHIVLNYSLKNLTDAQKSMYQLGNFFINNIPDNISENIIDFNGRSVKQGAINENTLICMERAFITKGFDQTSESAVEEVYGKVLNGTSGNYIKIAVAKPNGQAYVMQPNETIYITYRISLTLI